MKPIHISPVYQNLIVGTLAGSMMAILLRFFVLQTVAQWFWVVFFFIGPLIGYFSGIERQRMVRLAREKEALVQNVEAIQQRLRQSAQKYTLMVDSLGEALFLTTEEGRFLLFNPALTLLTGYDALALRRMRLDNIRMVQGGGDHQEHAWVDNGIHRYEECWKTQSGSQIFVEVSAKTLRFEGRQVILYCVRDISRRKRREWEEKKVNILSGIRRRVEELALAQYAFYQRILAPQTHTVGLLKTLANENPAFRPRIASLLMEWGEASKFVGSLMEKNIRDLEKASRVWDLNAVIDQELDYLQKMTPLKDFSRQVLYAPDLPKIQAVGRDLSLAFGILIRALLESMEPPRRREITVMTHLKDNQILVDMKAPSAQDFYRHLYDLLHQGGALERLLETERSLAEAVCKACFEAFGATLFIKTAEGQGVTIRVAMRAPTPQRAREESLPTPPESGPPKDNGLLIA